MAAETVTPDEQGIPLPLVPIDETRYRTDELNWHHHFHPRTSPLLLDEAGVVIRVARLQKAVKYGNHTEYHQHFTGPELPEDDQSRISTIILARAGYIPEHGLLMRGAYRRPKIVRLSEAQRWSLMDQTQIRSGSAGATRDFLVNKMFNQDMSDFSSNIIDEFLDTPNYERRIILGRFILGEALHRVIAPAATDYMRAWQHERIPRHLPRKPQRFVRRLIGGPNQRIRLIEDLHTQLQDRAA